MNPILHIAGPMGPDRIQRCARCYTPLVTYGVLYPEGADIEVGDNYSYQVMGPSPAARLCRVTEIGSVVDELTYRSYREQRRLSPHVTPERWQLVYLNALNLETRYQEEQAGNVLMVESFGAGELS